MLYFAYGSNMDPCQMRRRCPTSRFEGTAILLDHKLEFTLRSRRRRCGVANVVPTLNSAVFGVLYRINGSHDWKVLDRAEGFSPLHKRRNTYVRRMCQVQKQSGYPNKVRAFIYVGPLEKSPLLPSKAYLKQMIAGIDRWGLPESYKNSLASLLSD